MILLLVAHAGCGGMVGAGWGCFNSSGTAAYGYYDDMWTRTVNAGNHSQLLEINTKQIGGDGNRTARIYQTVRVMPGTAYELSLKGMIRADEQNTDDPWRYRVYVGFDYSSSANWQAVSDWRELPWDTYYSRTDPGSFSSYSTKVTPSGYALTVFIHAERKSLVATRDPCYNRTRRHQHVCRGSTIRTRQHPLCDRRSHSDDSPSCLGRHYAMKM